MIQTSCGAHDDDDDNDANDAILMKQVGYHNCMHPFLLSMHSSILLCSSFATESSSANDDRSSSYCCVRARVCACECECDCGCGCACGACGCGVCVCTVQNAFETAIEIETEIVAACCSTSSKHETNAVQLLKGASNAFWAAGYLDEQIHAFDCYDPFLETLTNAPPSEGVLLSGKAMKEAELKPLRSHLHLHHRGRCEHASVYQHWPPKALAKQPDKTQASRCDRWECTTQSASGHIHDCSCSHCSSADRSEENDDAAVAAHAFRCVLGAEWVQVWKKEKEKEGPCRSSSTRFERKKRVYASAGNLHQSSCGGRSSTRKQD